MSIYYIIGIIGAFFVLLAFTLSNNERSRMFLWDEIFNFIGSLFLTIYALDGKMWPFFALNLIWILWSINILIREIRLSGKPKVNLSKKTLYIDMDGVIVDFQSGVSTLSEQEKKEHEGKYCKVPDIFSKMVPMDGALEAVEILSEEYDVYILSSPGWDNASAWSDKYNWVAKHLPFMRKRLILSSHKNLNIGACLIDDSLCNGAGEFDGEFIHFGKEKYPDWNSVLKFLTKEDM